MISADYQILNRYLFSKTSGLKVFRVFFFWPEIRPSKTLSVMSHKSALQPGFSLTF